MFRDYQPQRIRSRVPDVDYDPSLRVCPSFEQSALLTHITDGGLFAVIAAESNHPRSGLDNAIQRHHDDPSMGFMATTFLGNDHDRLPMCCWDSSRVQGYLDRIS